MAIEEIRAADAGRVGQLLQPVAASGARSRCVKSLKARLAFVLISKLYRQMYANTGIATDSARVQKANRWARLIAAPCQRLFAGRPMPELQVPGAETAGLAGA